MRFILTFTLLIAFSIFRYLFPERDMQYIGLRALTDHFSAVGMLIGVLLVSGGIGQRIITYLRVTPTSYLETIVLTVPLGLGVFSYGILALGFLGLLHAHFFLFWYIFLFYWSFQEWWHLAITGMVKFKETLCTFRQITIIRGLLVFVILMILFITLLQTLTPAWDHDGLMYHLQGPRIFLDSGRILPLPDVWQANGPFTIEMLFMFGLRFGSDTFAKLLHLSYAILLVLATLVVGRRLLGRENGWMAAVVLVAIPIFPQWSGLANADMAWAVYEFLGIYAMIQWIVVNRREWLVLSGLMVGMALGCKYLALGYAGVLGLMVIFYSRKRGVKRVIENAIIFGCTAFLIGLPWYLKNWIWTGNPVYPLYFGGVEWPKERVELLMSFLNSFGTGHRVVDYLLLPWNIYAQNQRFSTSGNSIETPSFLFPLILLYPFVRHKKIIHIVAIMTVFRLVVWAMGSLQIRFLLPAFPGLSLIVASIFSMLDHTFIKKRGGYILQSGLLGGVSIITLLISVYLYALIKPMDVVLGNESKFNFLNRVIADFPAITYVQEHLTPEDRALIMWEGEGYYCDDRCVPDTERGRWTYMAKTADYDVLPMARALRESRISHLLFINEGANFNLHIDPTGENEKAASFFLEEFKDVCTKIIFSDRGTSLYKITCQN